MRHAVLFESTLLLSHWLIPLRAGSITFLKAGATGINLDGQAGVPGKARQHLLHAPQLLRGVLLKLVLRRFRFPREIALRIQTEPCNDVDADPARTCTVHSS